MTANALATAARPLEGNHLESLKQTVADFSAEELLWASGYLAGLASSPAGIASAPVTGTERAGDVWTILFATETGNSRRVAEMLAERAREAGLAVELRDLRDFKPKALARTSRALFVVATHGIGEAPDGSEMFFEYWFSDRAPKLADLKYSVLALGDSSYADFCVMGQKLDARLTELGANAVAARAECDLDFDAPAGRWVDAVVEKAAELTPADAPRTTHLRAVSNRPSWSRQRPYAAEVVVNQPLTGPGSTKAVYHVELDIEDSGLSYLPGDSLGVVPANPPELVTRILESTGLDGEQAVDVDGESRTLAGLLAADKEITVLSRPLLQLVASQHAGVQAVLDNRDALAQFFRTRQVIDVVNDYPLDWSAQGLADALRRLTPRLYSIASSADVNPGEVHLTVGLVRYDAYGRDHWGAASTYLTADHDRVPVYVETNDHFRLPDDGATPIIMIGAGTGVAPYRAFVEHRAAHGQRGDNWLFFGDRNFSSDFLYQLEWLRYRKEGMLKRLDVAFSRDQAEKIYVQQRLREHGAEVWRWLERGAHIYVCGDADHMAAGVHKALQSVIAKSAGMSAERAAELLTELKSDGRYLRDVY